MKSKKVDRVVLRVLGLVRVKADLARHLGLHRQALASWDRIPAKHVIGVEEFLDKKITRHEMRPDIYPDD